MRVFTSIERELLRRINNGNGGNLYNLIDPWIEGVSFQVNLTTKAVTIIFENDTSTQQLNILNRLQEIQSILIQSVNLLKLFEDKGYIFSYTSTHNIPNTFTFGQAAVNSPSISYPFPDIRISELFTKYATQEIFVTPELDKFIKDNFRTREELRANRQFRTTLAALVVAIIALFSNLGFNVYNVIKSKPATKRINIYNDSLKKDSHNSDTNRILNSK